MLDFVKGDAKMAVHDISDLNLLVVDDDDFILFLSTRILGRIGCRNVTTVNNGRRAIDQLTASNSRFDVVITDLNMPEMDGVELLRHIAESKYSGGIILLSGEEERILETAHDLARSHNLNVMGTIPKPLHPDPLKELLETYREIRKTRPDVPRYVVTIDELKAGIDGRELQLFYQPKVDIKTGKVSGLEALARWEHPERGILGPDTFIPVAEKVGLIDELTRAVCRKAVGHAGHWHANGFDMQISINASVNSFLNINFSEFLIMEAQNEKLDPSKLTLEVTESQVMSDTTGCLEKMMQVRMKKIGLSIDDFGTGNSTMVQLKRIPFTELKIDRNFVSGVKENSSSRAILESSISLGKKLNMSTVAEGVETREDWDLVEQLNCDFVQGYYIARPMPENEVMQFVKNWSGPH